METVAPRKAEERTLPSGNVAFLFTDIVGSTTRWEENPGAMRADVRRHDELMRIAVGSSNGVVFKTIGDAFCAAFSSIEDAVGAALNAQRDLTVEKFASSGGISVRMALHCGEADERDADYFGPALNRVARLLAIGHGGQILLSNAAAEAAATLSEVTLKDLGYHRLKDLTAAEHVFQIVAPDLTAEFPELRSLSFLQNNLPQQVSSFIGREEDVVEIKAILLESRLITLSGAGGVGKTRCALQVAADVLEQYADGVWFVDLAPVADPVLIANAIGRVFKVQHAPNQSMLETLTCFLQTKEALIVLDNCEHVVSEASKVTAALLRSCSKVRILATSREALNVAGEVLYRMPSLAVPPKQPKRITADDALEYSAIALFEQRGRLARGDFAVTDENAAVVADVCRRLDGIPLAIELAAARLRVLTPAQLAVKLDERFRVLTGGDRSALPRQQTMRALIDWSYDLLNEREQSVFRRVSVFAGGFAMEAAIAVCASDTMDEFDVIDVVQSLCEKSLVLADPGKDAVRYRLLESTREYAHEKLIACNELDDTVERHARTYALFAEELERKHDDLSPNTWLQQGLAEIENMRTALTWSFGPHGDALVGQRIVVTLPRIFGVAAATEGLEWVKTALERVRADTPAVIVGGLELAHATFASVFNRFNAAYAASQRALQIFASIDEPAAVADALRLSGRSLIYLGRVEEGENLLQESLSNRKSRGSARIGGILGDLAVARAFQGDLAGARALFARATEMFEAGADGSKLAVTAATLAEAEFFAGDAEAAVRFAEEALKGARALGRYRTAAAILGNLAAYRLALQQFDGAKSDAHEALDICRNLQSDAVSVAFALQHLAAAAVLQDGSGACEAARNRARAAHLLGFVDAQLSSLEIEREYTELQGYTQVLAALREQFADAELQSMLQDGKKWNEDRAVSEALAL